MIDGWYVVYIISISKMGWYGDFHNHCGTPIAGRFIRESPTKMDDLRVPLFQETPIYTRWRVIHDGMIDGMVNGDWFISTMDFFGGISWIETIETMVDWGISWIFHIIKIFHILGDESKHWSVILLSGNQTLHHGLLGKSRAHGCS